MKHGQNNRRNRSRGNGKRYPNQRGGAFESSGPDVKVRGTAQQVFEKYLALARDASATGDRIAAESYMQHAEHYYRIISAEAEAGNGRNRPQRPNRGGYDDFDDGMDQDDDAQPGQGQEASVERQGPSHGQQNSQSGNMGGNGGGNGGGDAPGTGEQPDVEPVSLEPMAADGGSQASGGDGERGGGNGRGPRGPRRGRPRANKPAADPSETEQPVS